MESTGEIKSRRLETLLWSVALPGFGQLLNKKYIKGILLVALEFLVNVMGNLNRVIILSFQGNIAAAVEQTNYMWVMFYPCLYLFGIWDAYKDAGGGEKPFAFLPFVFTAYFMTVGLIFSSKLTIFGYLIGPIWLPFLFAPGGILAGIVLSKILLMRWIDK